MNQYSLKEHITIRAGKVNAAQALILLKDMLLPLGYTGLESVRGDPPHVVLTIVAVKRETGTMIPISRGMDPEKIPKTDDLVTQVMTLTNLDPAKAREAAASVLGERADITVNVESKTLIITDSSANIRRAAALLLVLEKQAAEAKK
jgi:type II secretory pathway component GspD/PulD (secretin)